MARIEQLERDLEANEARTAQIKSSYNDLKNEYHNKLEDDAANPVSVVVAICAYESAMPDQLSFPSGATFHVRGTLPLPPTIFRPFFAYSSFLFRGFTSQVSSSSIHLPYNLATVALH